MKKIKLTQEKFAIVDDVDFEYLNQWKWRTDNTGYAKRKEWLPVEKKYRDLYMHRLINKTSFGFDTDHINRNKLDNRKSNLRSVTKSRNQMNKGIQNNNTSGFKGIFFEKGKNKWRIRLSIDKNRISFGSYKDFQLAILAYKEIERKYLS